MGGKEKRQALGEVNRYAAVDWGWGVEQVYCCNSGRTESDGKDRRLTPTWTGHKTASLHLKSMMY